MNFIRQLTKRLLTTCVPPQRLLTRGPRCAPTAPPRLALTFDDGPHPIHTARLLDALQAAGAAATFFVIGKEAERYPNLIRRMVQEGHEVANHTWTHSEPAKTTPAEFLAEVRRTDELLIELTGRIPLSMRPPKGELNWTKLCGLWRQEKTVSLWSADPKDYRMNDAGEMALWCARYQPRDGDVVLLHDNHPWAIGAVTGMQSRGVFERFQAVTVSELTGRTDCGTATGASIRRISSVKL